MDASATLTPTVASTKPMEAEPTDSADVVDKPMSNAASTDDVAAVANDKDAANQARSQAPSPKRARIQQGEHKSDPDQDKSEDKVEHSSHQAVKPLVINLQGTIAAGKSTQLNALREHFANDSTVVFVDEPLDEWQNHRLLEFMYNGLQAIEKNVPLGDEALDPSSFQTVALATRTARLFHALTTPGVRVVICERSPEADKHVFADATLKTTAQRNAYTLVYDKVLSMLPPVTKHHFLLKLDVASAKLRIGKRARAEEQTISLEYLGMLDKGHEALLESAGANQTVFDGAMDREELSKLLIDRIEQLKQA